MTWAGKRVGTWIPPEGRTHTQNVYGGGHLLRPFLYLEKKRKRTWWEMYEKKRRNSFTKDKVKPKWLAPKAQSTLWSGSERTSLSLSYSAPCHLYLFHILSKDFLKESHTQPVFLLPSEAQQIVAWGVIFLSIQSGRSSGPVRMWEKELERNKQTLLVCSPSPIFP